MNLRENYNDLYLFVLVADEGSFTKAAARLGMAQSGVSRSIRGLEERLGVQLLTRTTRRLALTQAGEQLYRTAQESFARLDNGLNLLAHYRDTPSGTVRINASLHAIDKILLPKLAAFRRLYPDVRLELINESRFVDIIQERFDAGVRLGGDVGEGMVAVRIGLETEMAVVGTPEHFRRYGFPETRRRSPPIPASPTSLPTAAITNGNSGKTATSSSIRRKDNGRLPTAIWKPPPPAPGWGWPMYRSIWWKTTSPTAV